MPLLSDSPFYLFHKSKKFDFVPSQKRRMSLYKSFYLKGGSSGQAEKSRGESRRAWALGAAPGTLGAESPQQQGPPGHVADDETLAPQMGGSTSKALCRIGCLIFILALIFPEIGWKYVGRKEGRNEGERGCGD